MSDYYESIHHLEINDIIVKRILILNPLILSTVIYHALLLNLEK